MRGLVTAVGRITVTVRTAMSLWLVYQTRGVTIFYPVRPTACRCFQAAD